MARAQEAAVSREELVRKHVEWPACVWAVIFKRSEMAIGVASHENVEQPHLLSHWNAHQQLPAGAGWQLGRFRSRE
jgi:hypothetical protein